MKRLIGLYDPVMSYAAIGRVLGITKGGVKAITLVISGACRDKGTGELSGADKYAEAWTRANEIDCNLRPARWKKDGHPQAGPVRNRRMLDELQELMVRRQERGRVVAMPGGKGTANCVMQAKARGLVVHEVAT